jgi:tetratricopeptide (TPR) repeat protein
MKLSLCMIVKDEEAQLPRCLESVRAVVDEIVVVDTGSSDRTIEIAKSFGAAVQTFAWCDDFAAARNASLQAAQGDWILVLDADEVLLPDIVPSLQQAIQNPEYLVVTLLRQEVGAKQAPYSLVSRLFRNRPDIRFSHPYHELIDDSVVAILQREPQWRVVQLAEVAIAHTGYQTAVIDQRQKHDRARRTMENYLNRHSTDAYICNKLGALYIELGEVKQGLALLKRGLQVPQVEPTVLYELHYHLGDTYAQLQNFLQAKYHFWAATQQPIAPQLKLGAYTNWGNLCLMQGDVQGAKPLFEQVVAIAPEFAPGQFNLGRVWKELGHLAEAIGHYQQAVQLNSAYPEAYQNLGVVLFKLGRVADSLAAFRQAIDLYKRQGSPEATKLQQGLRELGLQV